MAADGELLAVVLPVLVGLALIAIASLVVRHGQGHRHNMFFAALYFLSGLKSVSEGLRLRADAWHDKAALFPEGAFWSLLASFCALAMLPLLFLFVSHFPHPLAWTARRPRSAALAFVPSLLMAALLVAYVVGSATRDAFASGVQAFNFVFFVVTVAAILLLLRTRSTSRDPVERQQSLYVLLGFLPGFVAGWTVSGLQFLAASGSVNGAQAQGLIDNIIQFVSPVFELLAASLVGFAILKYNILGVDPRFRLGVKSALVGIMFVVLFLATQAIENLVLQDLFFAFAGPYGSFLFSGVAGVVLFKPIEKVSGKVSDKLLPTAAGKDGLLPAEEIYHAQATYILRDAKVTDRELAGLRNLRTQLKISEARAREIEEDVERILHVDDARLGNRATGHGTTELRVTRGAKGPPRPPPAVAPGAGRPPAPAAKPAAPGARPATGAVPAKPAGDRPAGDAVAKAPPKVPGKAPPPPAKPGPAAGGPSGAGGVRKRST